jgi:AraC-like DNA-binding protein
MLEPTTRMPLPGHPCLTTTSIEQARAHLSDFFWPHRLALAGPERGIEFRHNLAHCGALSLNALRYGRDVAIDATPSDHAYLVKFTLAGTSEVLQGANQVVSRAGMVCVMNPTSSFRVRLSADHNQLTVRVDGNRLQRFLETELRHRPRAPLEFQPFASACRSAAPGLARLVKTLCDDLDDQHAAFGHGVVARHLEETLFGLLLTELPHNYRAQLMQADADDAPRTISRVRDFIEAHTREVLTVHDLARAAGTSARTLQQAFGKHVGTTPMAYLRDQRLHLARRQILRDRDRAITDVALECGFTHLSRFARYYRERFGETPHATRRH